MKHYLRYSLGTLALFTLGACAQPPAQVVYKHQNSPSVRSASSQPARSFDIGPSEFRQEKPMRLGAVESREISSLATPQPPARREAIISRDLSIPPINSSFKSPETEISTATGSYQAAEQETTLTALPVIPEPAPVNTASGVEVMRDNELTGLSPATGRAANQKKEDQIVVNPGDTLYSLSKAHGVDWYDLAQANGILSPQELKVGQVLVIPGRSDSLRYQENTPLPGDELAGVANDATISEKDASKLSNLYTNLEDREVTTSENYASQDGFIWPVKGKIISSFGKKTNGLVNDGVNIHAAEGTPIRATENGKVVYAGNELRGYGNLVILRHPKGWLSAYAHMKDLMLTRGDEVQKGQIIGHVGKSGNVTSPQLHFGLRKGRDPVDPLTHLAKLDN